MNKIPTDIILQDIFPDREALSIRLNAHRAEDPQWEATIARLRAAMVAVDRAEFDEWIESSEKKKFSSMFAFREGDTEIHADDLFFQRIRRDSATALNLFILKLEGQEPLSVAVYKALRKFRLSVVNLQGTVFMRAVYAHNDDVVKDPSGEAKPTGYYYRQAIESEDLREQVHSYSICREELEGSLSKWLDKWLPQSSVEHFSAESSRVHKAHSDSFPIHTSQEWTALQHFAGDGRFGRYLTENDQRGALRHQRPGAHFFTELLLLDEERDAGHGVELLRQAIAELDIDDSLAWLYVSHLLVPPGPLPAYASASAWIDLDDVARKTMGGYAPNPQELYRRREKVYHAIRCAVRLHIGGKRNTKYQDKQTGQEIDTEIYTTPWQILSREEPAQPGLWKCDTVPVQVELVASRQWTALTTHPATAQYLPFGEILGAIPGSQAGGAWARALGLAYLNWCRWHLHEALSGASPTRQYLLDHNTAKKAPYQEILESKNPQRAIEYWKSAEGFLSDGGLIEVPKRRRKAAVRQGWKKQWLAESPKWSPGQKLRPVLEDLAKNRFQPKPRELNPAKRRPGRPRKKKNE